MNLTVKIIDLKEETLDTKLVVQDSSGNDIGTVEVTPKDGKYIYAFDILINGKQIPISAESRSIDSVAVINYDDKKEIGEQPARVDVFRR